MTLSDSAIEAANQSFYGALDDLGVDHHNWVLDLSIAIEAFLAELGGRVVVEKPCEHEELRFHAFGPIDATGRPESFCPGGSRQVIWEPHE